MCKARRVALASPSHLILISAWTATFSRRIAVFFTCYLYMVPLTWWALCMCTWWKLWYLSRRTCKLCVLPRHVLCSTGCGLDTVHGRGDSHYICSFLVISYPKHEKSDVVMMVAPVKHAGCLMYMRCDTTLHVGDTNWTFCLNDDAVVNVCILLMSHCFNHTFVRRSYHNLQLLLRSMNFSFTYISHCRPRLLTPGCSMCGLCDCFSKFLAWCP